MRAVPEIKFAPARRGRIAYQDFGSGGHTMVAIPPMAQNIEVAWERPEVRAMLERFASFCRYIPFDKRGTGSSDRSILVPNIDERVEDLRAVMDDAGVDRAHLFAQSEGGPMTLLFAATYPDRVDSIVLVGSSARFVPDRMSDEEHAAMVSRQEHFCSCWGTSDSFVVDLFAKSMAADQEFRDWHTRYERLAASSDSLRDLFAQTRSVDVREVLRDIVAPVLVIRHAGDPVTDSHMAREVAELVPDGRYLEVPGDDHFAYLGNVETWMSEVERFVTGGVRSTQSAPAPSKQPPSRVHIQTLGRFAVMRDGDEVPISAWGSRRARTLLKRLVVARGWPVTRDELTDLLWPDEIDAGRVGARLSVLLSGVRKILDGGVIADRETVALDLEHVSCDVDLLLRSDDDSAVVATYTGEFLPEDRYEDWSALLRDEARSHFVISARRRWEQAVQIGVAGGSADIARRWIDADPYDEEAHRALVRSLDDVGDRLGAQNARRQWVERMREIGVDADVSS